MEVQSVHEELLEDAKSHSVSALPGQPKFVILPTALPNNAGVTVHIGVHTVKFLDATDAETIERMLRVLCKRQIPRT